MFCKIIVDLRIYSVSSLLIKIYLETIQLESKCCYVYIIYITYLTMNYNTYIVCIILCVDLTPA